MPMPNVCCMLVHCYKLPHIARRRKERANKCDDDALRGPWLMGTFGLTMKVSIKFIASNILLDVGCDRYTFIRSGNAQNRILPIMLLTLNASM